MIDRYLSLDGALGAELQQSLSPADAVINNIGRAGFLPSFAVFPVHFFDEERGLCIFEFPPMRSFIAAARVSRDVDDVVF